MADHPSDSTGDTGDGTNLASPPSAPLWVKVFGIIALVLVVLFVVLHFTGHAPRGHTFAGETEVQKP
jgi:hypothetical protein